MSGGVPHCRLFALLCCSAVWSVSGQVSICGVTSQVKDSHLNIVVTLSRWQGNFSYQLTVPAGKAVWRSVLDAEISLPCLHH